MVILIMKYLYIFLTLIFWFNLNSLSYSACSCECVNGQVQAICSSSIDLEPICAPRICPLVTPSIKPLDPITLPPLGTSQCTNMQVYNMYTYQYEWKEVCY